MEKTKQIELTYEELFLIEMAVDEILYRGFNSDSELYKKYRKIDRFLCEKRIELGHEIEGRCKE